jgi:hypothetical protein
MSTDVTPVERQFVPGFGELLTARDVDYRKGAPRQINAVTRALTSDLGGDLSVAQRLLVQRTAVLQALLEHAEAGFLTGRPHVALGDYVSMVAAQTRILRVLGTKRVPKDVTPSVAEYLAHKAKQIEVSP